MGRAEVTEISRAAGDGRVDNLSCFIEIKNRMAKMRMTYSTILL